MTKTVKTTKISGGADYAKVADRIKLFWEENPNGKIEPEREELDGGKIRFVTRVWRDINTVLELAKTGATADVIKLSANAVGSADAVKKGDKENEKLETVATGRALAALGYLASGEVASREEMEQFEDYKAEKHAEEVMAAIKDLKGCEDMAALQRVFVGLPLNIRGEKAVIAEKDKMKEALSGKDEKTDESRGDTTE